MAIIKVSYTRSRAAIKANLRYNMHRPNKANEKMSRVLFGQDGEMTKQEAYELIDSQKVTYFRIILNFDPVREDTKRDLDLRSIAKQTILALEDRLQRTINFIGVEHDDHGKNLLRHIHTIALVKLKYREKLTISDWRAIREIATQQALFQRKARDLIQHYQLDKNYLKRSIDRLSPSYRPIGMAGGRARHVGKARPAPLACPKGLQHTTVKMKNGKSWCRVCERVLEQEQGLGL
jgi:hypothetical protein